MCAEAAGPPVPSGNRREPKLDDGVRFSLAAAANLVAFGVAGLVYRFCLRRYYAAASSLLWPWLGLIGMTTYFGWVAPYLPRVWQDLRKIKGERSRKRERVPRSMVRRIYLGVFANIAIIGWGVLMTGGVMASPFAAYGLAFVAFGQFLSEKGRTYLLFILLGVLWYFVLLGPAHLYAQKTIDQLALASSDSGMRWAHFLVGSSIVVIGSLVVRKKRPWERS